MARVPDEVMQRLHEANERFRDAGARLGNVESMDLGQRRDAAKAIRAAEQDLEELTREIHGLLDADPAPHPEARTQAG